MAIMRFNLPASLRPLVAPAVALEGGALALVWLLGATWLGMSPSPLTGSWRRWQVPTDWNPTGIVPTGRTLPTPNPLALLLYGLLLVGMAAAGWWAVQRILALAPDRTLLLFVLGVAAVVGLTLLVLPTLPSDDLFSYILYGRIGVLHHANPLVATPDQFPRDPFLHDVFWHGTRSVYGPAWLIISDLLTVVAQGPGGSAAIYVLLYKLLGLGCHLINAVLIWKILGRIAPERQVAGTVLYAWNPLALWEFAASGHNDALMLTWFLLGCWSLARTKDLSGPTRRSSEILALVAWGLSIATKYVFIVLVPLWLWHVALQMAPYVGEQPLALWGRRARAVGWRGGVVLGTAVVLLVPFWSGPTTLLSLVASPPAQQLGNSLMDSISWPLRSLAQGILGLTSAHARAVVIPGLKTAGLAAFVIVWLALGWRQAPKDVLRAWGWALLAYLFLASGWFWPWYVTWPLMVVALRPLDRLSVATLLLAAGALALYPFLPLIASGIFGFRSLVTFGPALAYLVWHLIKHRANLSIRTKGYLRY